MLGSRIEELLESEMEANGGFAVITDEAKQRQLLLDDEEEDFMDEGNLWDNFLRQYFKTIFWDNFRYNFRDSYKIKLGKISRSILGTILIPFFFLKRALTPTVEVARWPFD